MSDPIPFLDLPRQHAPILDEIIEGIRDHVSRAAFIGGKTVSDFEGQFAEYCGTSGCVGVANGTEALMLALMGAGVKGGDTVLLPAYTFIATAEAVSHLGARVRLVDSDEDSYNISVAALESCDHDGVTAVVPVHLYGQPADMKEINALAASKGWKVIEDSAQSHGARYDGKPVGSHGDFGCFSFYPGKNLGALGDAGAIVGPQGDAMERIRRLSNHGRLAKYEHGEVGVNSRLDAIQALALSIKLRHISDWNASRARVAAAYDERLAGLAGIKTPRVLANRTHVYHLYVLLVEERDNLAQHLEANAIGHGLHYPMPLHLQPAYRHLGYEKGDFPVAEAVGERCISLPMFPELGESQIDRICAVVRDFARAGGDA